LRNDTLLADRYNGRNTNQERVSVRIVSFFLLYRPFDEAIIHPMGPTKVQVFVFATN